MGGIERNKSVVSSSVTRSLIYGRTYVSWEHSMQLGEATKQLQAVGLTKHEAVAFLNLARLGAATAREVARVSGVNRVQAYRALDSLEARGLVEVTLDRPKRFASRAVDEVFDLLAEEKRLELEGLEAVRKGVR